MKIWVIKLTGKRRKLADKTQKNQNFYVTQITRRLVMGLYRGDPTGVGKLRTTDIQYLVQDTYSYGLAYA